MRPTHHTSLWLTLRGASFGVAVGWVLWAAGAALVATAASQLLGPAGPIIGVLAVGWVFARGLPPPLECLRRYHLDDDELIVAGPGRSVRRLRWTDVEVVTALRRVVRVEGRSTCVSLPRAPLFGGRAMVPVLRRVMPTAAEALWTCLDERVIQLIPDAEPPLHALAWWAYIPAVLAAAMVSSVLALVTALALACAERGLALARARRRAVTLHPAGVAVAGVFAPWAGAATTPWPGGLRVVVPALAATLVSETVPNFWAAAAVIQLRALVGPLRPVEVSFRLHAEGDELALVGEVESET
jgi:hypothetical protein